jgi:ubiquinone/menaquinone biosynthesis C-methylase UbiE
MDLDTIRADFDAIARLGERSESGTDRFDLHVHSRVPVESKRILDVGCGTGRLTARLAELDRTCLGVDLSPEMIRRATARCQKLRGVSFVVGDFLEVDLASAGFDCVVSVAALHHMPVEAAILRMKQLLAPGGRLIVNDLRASAGFRDDVAAWSVLAREAGRRLRRTGWPLSPRAERRAWARHEARETYPSYESVVDLARRLLPGAEICMQPTWRYTIVWDKAP